MDESVDGLKKEIESLRAALNERGNEIARLSHMLHNEALEAYDNSPDDTYYISAADIRRFQSMEEKLEKLEKFVDEFTPLARRASKLLDSPVAKWTLSRKGKHVE